MQQILQRHDQMPTLDDAIAAVLQRIGGKEVVPAFAETLDSKNDEARLRAVSFLSKVARFADKSGNLQPYTGPLDSPRNHQNEPRSGSPLTTDQYASYWKIWWAENKGKLGFAQ
jgi:hypothetical protein